MSIPITKIEATAVARFLSATLPHIDGAKLSHLSWLHVLARSYGYRNWNAIQPQIDDVPEVEKFDDGFGFAEVGVRRFAIASIDLPGRERSFHTVSHDSGKPSMQVLATALAAAVSGTADFRGMKFRYTRPDPGSPPSVGDERSAATTPVVATSENGGTKIMLWWIYVWFQKPYDDPDRVVVEGISFEHGAYYEYNPTDCFLKALTGVPSVPRQCLYVPVQASPPYLRRQEAYYPLILTEGKTDGEEANWNCGLDRMLAVRRAYLHNRQAGLSNLDIADIVGRHRYNEPDPNAEPEPDIYWMSED